MRYENCGIREGFRDGEKEKIVLLNRFWYYFLLLVTYASLEKKDRWKRCIIVLYDHSRFPLSMFSTWC